MHWYKGIRAAIFFAFMAASAFAGMDVNVYDEAVYVYLDKLYAAGLLQAYMPHQRPLARNVVAALVAEARRNAGHAAGPLEPVIRDLEQEFAHGMAEARFRIEPLEEVSLAFTATNQAASEVLNNGLGSTSGRVQPLLAYSDGDRFDKYSNGYFYTVHTIQASPYFAGYVQPKYYARSGETDNGGIGLYRGYAKAGYKNFEVQIGRDDIRWGPGEHALFFSGNARALDMIKVTTPGAFRLPGFLRHAGHFRGTAFVSWLGDEYHPKGATLSGYRLDYDPFHWVNVGFDHAVFLGGEGARSPSAGQAIRYFIGFLGTSGLDQVDSNHLIGPDITFRIRKAMGLEIYGKALFEDTQAEREFMMKSDVSYLGGLYFPKIHGLELLSLRSEVNYSGQFPYTHSFYTDGFALRDKFMGYDAGPDTYCGSVSARYQFNLDEFVRLDARYLRRSGDHYRAVFNDSGNNTGIVTDINRPEETNLIIRVGGQKRLSKKLKLYLEAGYDRKRNADFIEGQGANEFALRARMLYR